MYCYESIIPCSSQPEHDTFHTPIFIVTPSVICNTFQNNSGRQVSDFGPQSKTCAASQSIYRLDFPYNLRSRIRNAVLFLAPKFNSCGVAVIRRINGLRPQFDPGSASEAGDG